MKEIVQMNYITAVVECLKLEVKGSLNYFYQTMINKSSSRADEDDDYYCYCGDAEDEDDYTDNHFILLHFYANPQNF